MKTNTKKQVTPTFTPVTGSSLVAGYAADSGNLLVKLVSGETYQYAGVSESVVKAFAAAKSKGTYFGTNIRNKFTATKV